MPVLSYDKEQGLFSFVRPEGSTPFPGASISMTPGGRRYTFEDISPMNYFNIQLYKSFYSGEAKATHDAAERVKEITEERSEDFAGKYAHLITGHPYEHQLATINLMQRNDRFALLLEQGLGKTYIALQSFKMFKERDGYLHAVVVCPKIVYQTWLSEAEKFAPELKILQYRGTVEQRKEVWDETPTFDVLLTTYEVIRKSGSPPLADRANSWAWPKLPFETRKKLVGAMSDKLGKHMKILLADYDSMSKSERRKWRTKVGPILSSAGEGYWSERSFAYMPYEGIRNERYAMQSLIQEEEDHYYPINLINRRVRPNVVVFDEASRLVNHRAKQAEAAEEIESKRKYLLSGTLCVGRPTDMFMPMNVLDKSIIGMNWTKFRDKFCYVSKFNRNIITGYKNLDILKRKIDPYIVEYKRDDCLDLPDRTIVSSYYEVDDRIVDLYDKVIFSDKLEIEEKTVFCPLQLQKLQKCMQLLSGFINTTNDYRMCYSCGEDTIFDCAMAGIRPGGAMCARRGDMEFEADPGITIELVDDKHNAKLELLRNDLEEIVPNEKVIIWYWYTFDYVKIVKLLEELDIRYIAATEENCAARFESDPECRVFVGQVVQGIGITLNSATTTIYYSHGLALEPRLQSMDRNHRIGQSKPVVVKDYVCRGSIEEAVVSLLQHKEDVKDFMQKRVECMACDSMAKCLEQRIRRYAEGCIHHGDMKKAEEKHTLKLRPMGECHEY